MISSHRLKHGEAHFDDVEAAARDGAHDESHDADDGEYQNEQYAKRYQSFQNRPRV
jgi:hypothetical protein